MEMGGGVGGNLHVHIISHFIFRGVARQGGLPDLLDREMEILSAGFKFCHVNTIFQCDLLSRGQIHVQSNVYQIQLTAFGVGFMSLKVTKESHKH